MLQSTASSGCQKAAIYENVNWISFHFCFTKFPEIGMLVWWISATFPINYRLNIVYGPLESIWNDLVQQIFDFHFWKQNNFEADRNSFCRKTMVNFEISFPSNFLLIWLNESLFGPDCIPKMSKLQSSKRVTWASTERLAVLRSQWRF